MGDDRILLHTCCAPCSTVVVPWWRAEGLEPEALFLNPNVQPDVEYERRRSAMESFARSVGLPLVVDDATTYGEWFRAVGRDAAGRGPGGARGAGPVDTRAGDRCRACLELRLREAAWATAERGMTWFSTTLSVSPYQRHDLIVAAGLRAAQEAGVEFVYADLRRHYRRSIDESRRLELYRQPYCGCVPSKWESWARRLERRRSRRTAA